MQKLSLKLTMMAKHFCAPDKIHSTFWFYLEKLFTGIEEDVNSTDSEKVKYLLVLQSLRFDC